MKLSLHQGDITHQSVDVIVNAANSSLLGGGGVDGAIHRAGGEEILEACRVIRRRQGKCATGAAVVTTAGRLPASWVVHTVGPVWQGGASGEADLLAGCYVNSLKLSEEKQARTVAFPNISTGIYGYPKERAASVALSAVRSFESTHIEEVIFVCYDAENYTIYQRLLATE
ncbi:MAG: O-acetyl-ADP-ribose deacetylase [Lewinella sp.]